MLDLRSFRAADCDANHYLVAAKLRKRLAVNKQAAQKFNVERFKLRKLNELELRKQYQIKISNRFAALENLSDSEDVNRGWENVQENIKTSGKESLGLYELKQHTPWFDEECLGFLDQRKQVKKE
jgi:benzoyl-CoA reductase/2-hydroxyglutaryl-CoA dehydratase subunit BcrC/BadD/HgdB